jgi:hypothetical protein
MSLELLKLVIRGIPTRKNKLCDIKPYNHSAKIFKFLLNPDDNEFHHSHSIRQLGRYAKMKHIATSRFVFVGNSISKTLKEGFSFKYG